MSDHPKFAALVVACIDGRLRNADGGLKARAGQLLEKKFLGSPVDHLAVAGASVDLSFTFPKPEETELFRGIELAYKAHGIRRVVIIEHENCGRYASAGILDVATPEEEIHAHRSRTAEYFLKERFPELTFERYYAKLNGMITPLI